MMEDADVLTDNQRQEALSRVYVQAVAAQAGMSFSTPTPDMGIDLSIHDIIKIGHRRIESGYRMDIQAKSTTLAKAEDTHVRYDLEVDAWNFLRLVDVGAPRLLIVLVLPETEGDWLTQTEQELTVRHAAYWVSLKGEKATTNRTPFECGFPHCNYFPFQRFRA